MLKVVLKREKERKEAELPLQDASSGAGAGAGGATIQTLSGLAAALFGLEPSSVRLVGLVPGKLPEPSTPLATLKKVPCYPRSLSLGISLGFPLTPT